jgi:hypothetical protein
MPLVVVKGSFVALALLSALGSATAAEVKIIDIKAYLFLQEAGKLSDNIVGGPPLMDTPKGGAPGGDTATGLLLDFIFEGDKNASPKYATATVDLTQTNLAGQRVVTHKAFANFIFGPDGVEHRAVFLEGATCTPIAVDVHAGKTSRSAQLEFQCAMTKAPD